MPVFAFLALVAFVFNVGVTAAEQSGIICCLTDDSDGDSQNSPLSSDKSAPCDCSTHLHNFVETTSDPFELASPHSDAQFYASLSCPVPDSIVQDISQPPRIS